LFDATGGHQRLLSFLRFSVIVNRHRVDNRRKHIDKVRDLVPEGGLDQSLGRNDVISYELRRISSTDLWSRKMLKQIADSRMARAASVLRRTVLCQQRRTWLKGMDRVPQ
jgi:hypothetical protein